MFSAPEPDENEEGSPLLGLLKQPFLQDKLTERGSKRTAAHDALKFAEDEGGNHHLVVRMILLTFGSTALFVLSLTMVCVYFHTSPIATSVVVAQFVCAGIIFSLVWRRQRWHPWMGRFLAAGSSAGAFWGLCIYYTLLVYHFQYLQMRVYTDLPASQPEAMVADGGMLGFTQDTRVDISQSVGFRAASLDKTLCVAPIVDSLMTSSDVVNYFAVGVDCCAWRSMFTCGDVQDAESHSGLMVLTPQQLVVPGMEWAIEDPALAESFHRAVKLQSAVFGSNVADRPRFVRWSGDPRRIVDLYLKRGISRAIAGTSVYFCICLFASLLAALGQQRCMQAVEEASDAYFGHHSLPVLLNKSARRPRGPPAEAFESRGA